MHEPYERLVPGAENAVLFIHGIVSTPRFWDALISAVPQTWSAVSLLLPGHGGTVTDFARVQRGEWQAHVHQAIVRLQQTHRRVYLVGHSMGGLLAILEATREDAAIAGLLLMAPALHIRVKPAAMVQNIWKGVGLGESAEEMARYYGVAQDWRVWRYIGWIPRYLELFALGRAARQALPRLDVPTRAFTHGRDELVSPKSGKLLAACPCVSHAVLPASMHHTLAEADVQTLRDALQAMCTD